MKKSYNSSSLIGRIVLFVLLFSASAIQAQVGIGTTNPNASSALDISSTTKGLLTPRMTTTQRNAIVAPTESLLVFDTTVDAFYFYDTTTNAWVKLANEGTIKRNNYKLVKSVADLAPELTAGGGSKYLLQTNTLYEINGTITLAHPIDLNDAYISGLDANEDRITKSTTGPIFEGTNGGSIRNVTLIGGPLKSAFNITGGNSLLVQNTVITSFADVGTISNLDLYFGSIVQFLANTNGITYRNINKLLLTNQAWLGNNGNTFETFSGTFSLIQKVSGFSQVLSGSTGMNITGITSITGDAVLSEVVFYGGGTYVTGSSPYTGYNFNKDWTVNCPGIPREGDSQSTANIYYASSSIVTLNNATPVKLPVTTSPIRMFRTSTRSGGDSSNSVVYEGKKSRSLNVIGSISFTAIAGMRFTFSIYKNGVQQAGTQVIYDVVDTNARQGLSIVGTVVANPTDYIEIYVERTTGSGSNQFLVTSYNLLVN